jgi:hypothetical protein
VSRTHGMSRTGEYRTWAGMRQRCQVKTNWNYADYGGRGITVCDQWQKFEAFYRDMGRRPSPRHTLERKNNSLGYSPENCVWATPLEQNNNTRANVFLVLNGESRTIAQWSRIVGISLATLSARRKAGLSDYDCLMTPVKPSLGRPARKKSIGENA